MEDAVRLVLATGKFRNTVLRNAIFYTEGCDSSIDHTLYDGICEEKDGGQMDYNSERTNYDNHEDTIPDIIMFALSINRRAFLRITLYKGDMHILAMLQGL